MERISIAPRTGWQQTVESQGLTFHSRTAPYWNETAYYAFSMEEIDALERAANEVHEVFLAAAQHVIDKGAYDRLAIPDHAAKLIEDSWNSDELHLYGRFDFIMDRGVPKMLEYNADTPTSLLEAAAVQWYWLEERFPRLDQFNSIHERLVDRWKEIGVRSPVHFASIEDNEEDFLTVEYLRDTAEQAGLRTTQLDIAEIGYNGRFVDKDDEAIRTLFKLYPWEWMVHEEFGEHLTAGTRFIEPPWKMLWSNKGILPVVHELAPHHPNILPAGYEPLPGNYVRKPLLSREGANIQIQDGGESFETQGEYGEEGYVYQQLVPQQQYDGKYPVLGLWMVGDYCRGMGIRESSTKVTDNLSQFTPHLIR